MDSQDGGLIRNLRREQAGIEHRKSDHRRRDAVQPERKDRAGDTGGRESYQDHRSGAEPVCVPAGDARREDSRDAGQRVKPDLVGRQQERLL